MYVCMYECACIYVCMCMYFECAFMYACLYVCMYARVYQCVYICMHVCMYACMCVSMLGSAEYLCVVSFRSKPPFRFLFDIVLSVMGATGFPSGLYTDAELDPASYAVRESLA